MRLSSLALIVLCGLLNPNIQAEATQSVEIINGDLMQGSMVVGQAAAGVAVVYQGKILKQDDTGTFVFGVGRDAPAKVTLELQKNGKTQSLSLPVKQRQWKIERVDGLPPQKVSPKAPEVLARIAREGKQVRTARNTDSNLTFFRMPFVMPAEGRISGVYGSQRVLNGEPKRPHYGLDVANTTGTSVIAPADGKVTLVHQDMFFSGGTLIIDHGHGISSTYIHLSAIDVKQGDLVRQGQTIAKIGATGRATGPHLDWRLNWFNTRLDPQLLIKN